MTNPRKSAPLVMVVEDDPFTLETLAEALSEDVEVLAVASAGIALAALELCAPALDAVVLDVDLGSPRLTGFDLARRARELNPLISVVFATGRSAADVAQHGVPAAAHLAKPFCLDGLARLVARLTAEPIALAAA